MAQMIFFIPDDKAAEILDELAERWGYDAGSGQTKQQFVKDSILAWIKSEYVAQKKTVAIRAAKAANYDEPDVQLVENLP